jgi:hypothetical protein
MGGQEIGRRTSDEEDYRPPVTVYAWSDITALLSE